MLVSAAVIRRCAVEPFTQRFQTQSTCPSASTVWLSINSNTCLSRRNQKMCRLASSTALSNPKLLSICIHSLVEFQDQYLSQPRGPDDAAVHLLHSVCTARAHANLHCQSGWVPKLSCLGHQPAHKEMIEQEQMPPSSNPTKRSWKCSKRHMSWNTSSLSALQRSTAADDLFLFIPLGCWCKRLER